MTTNDEQQAEPVNLPMVPSSIRSAVLAEADHLSSFVQTLTIEQWNMPSAVKEWTIGDVVVHLNLTTTLYSRLLGAVTSGKGSGGVWKAMGQISDRVLPPGSTTLNALNRAIPRVLDRALAPEVLKGQFAASIRALRERLMNVESIDYTRPIHYRGRPWPLSFFLAAMTNELAVHGWDMESRLDPGAHLHDEARAVLPWFYWSGTPYMLRLPLGTTGTVQVELTFPDARMWWKLSENEPTQGSGQIENPTATITGMSGVFVLVLAGRIDPADAFRTTSLQFQGNEELAKTFLSSWKLL